MEENNKPTTEKLVKSFINGVYTQKEARQVLDLLKKNEDFGIVEDCMSEAWTESQEETAGTPYEQQQNREEGFIFLSKIKRDEKRASKTIFVKRSLAIAASIAALVVLCVGGYTYLSSVSPQQILYAEETTTFGERKTILLPDGSTVNLNACSTLKYPTEFVENNRTIHLEGEAFFKVVKNDKQPFVVNTHKFDVTVLGTEFDVKAYREDEILSVSVASGKVQVDMPESMTRLTAYEQLIINSRTSEYQKMVDQQSVAIWRTGSLRFHKTPIKEVVKELERAYNHTFVFDPAHDFDNLITGEHHNKSLDAVLKSIEQTSGIKAKRSGKTITLYK